VAFPFICGVLAWRTGLHRRMPRWPALVPAGLLAVLTFQPFAVHPLYDVLAIGLLPVLVALGAASPVGGRTAEVAARIGALSYPLYLVHLPVIRAVLGATADSTVPLEARFAICVALSIALGFAAEALYDRPVRAALGAWLRRRRRARTVAPVEVARQPAPKPAPAAGVDVG
jgi:peptidoglycan/LPS O-acetylase OafA/YrhL